MLLIFLSSAASSRLAGLVGLLMSFSEGTWSARGCLCPTGAGHGPCFADEEPAPVWAIAEEPAITKPSVVIKNSFRIVASPVIREMQLRFRGI